MTENLEHILAHSFRDFHVKGFDYLCLKRSEAETVKVYFFEGDVAAAPEVVIPHDHRYPFLTECLAGAVTNVEFVEIMSAHGEAPSHERFEYLTPLNGGEGFKWRAPATVALLRTCNYRPGHAYSMRADQLHTITVRPDTVLRLTQLADVVPEGVPTRAYRPAGMREPPSLDGLYRPMDADHALMRLAQYRALLEA